MAEDYYRGFEASDSDDEVRAAFHKRYGMDPQVVIAGTVIKLAGPIPTNEDGTPSRGRGKGGT